MSSGCTAKLSAVAPGHGPQKRYGQHVLDLLVNGLLDVLQQILNDGIQGIHNLLPQRDGQRSLLLPCLSLWLALLLFLM
jgi:hypothetical protein